MAIDTYRRHRAEGVPASVALYWARSTPTEYDWNESSNGELSCTVKRDGFRVHVKVESDEYAESDGKFTDAWSPDVVEIPEHLRGRDSYRYYEPLMPYREHRKGLRGAGYSRHESHLLAERYVMNELRSNIGDGAWRYVVSATAYRKGIELGSASVGNVEFGDWKETREYASTLANDLIPEAIEEARRNLAALCGT